eukprot:1488725-Alexandrium_andersonii.AAC.1
MCIRDSPKTGQSFEIKFNEERVAGPHPEDPKTVGRGPRRGQRVIESRRSANKYGAWRNCLRCDLRLEYIAF